MWRILTSGPIASAALSLALLTAGCSDSTRPTGSRTLRVVRIDGLAAKQATHYCTPTTSVTEQWVGVGGATLIVPGDGTFELQATTASGNAQFHMNGVVKVYDVQLTLIGGSGVAGSVSVAGQGEEAMRFDRATSADASPADFTGRLTRDSAVITLRMSCLTPVAPDSAHVFTMVLR
jgi:hypothetical protein